jgi:hypothetical protein
LAFRYGCSAITSGALLHQKGCLKLPEGPGAPVYPEQTQSQAALALIRAHRAQLGLVTVVIGGNDVAGCARAPDLVSCIREKLPALKANLAAFLTQLRAAAGPNVVIAGVTYPDVLLGGDVSSEPLSRALAPESVAAFLYLLNPTLKAGYDAIGATFVDVTAATGAYLPIGQTTKLAPYGTSPSRWRGCASCLISASWATSIPATTATDRLPTSSPRRCRNELDERLERRGQLVALQQKRVVPIGRADDLQFRGAGDAVREPLLL